MSAYRKIMVAVDGSAAAARGLREAIRLANAERAELCLLHVVNESIAFAPLTGAAPLDLTATLREAGRQVLAAAKARAAKQHVRAKTVLCESIDRTAARSIVNEARRHHADLIVLGTHGRRGVRRIVLGSDAEQVVRAARVPVLLVRG